MEALILAGGLGTRLSQIALNVSKPMVPVNNQPFLKYVINYLLENGVNHIVLAVGHKANSIQSYFGGEYHGISIAYSIEDAPLGTGGAIKKALNFCYEEDVFVINGDTYFNVDLKKMETFHIQKNSYLTVAVKAMTNFERYGTVNIEENIIKNFQEKKPTIEGIINGGVYLMNRTILDSISEDIFSFENVVLVNKKIDIYAFESNGFFIDIGVPEDYHKAQNDFKLIQCNTIKELGVKI